MLTTNRRIIGILMTVALLLLIPFVAMQFTNEVNWTLSDFVIMGVLLLGTGLMTEFVIRKVKNLSYRIGIIAIILLAFLIVWVELAVGIFGSPFAGS